MDKARAVVVIKGYDEGDCFHDERVYATSFRYNERDTAPLGVLACKKNQPLYTLPSTGEERYGKYPDPLPNVNIEPPKKSVAKKNINKETETKVLPTLPTPHDLKDICNLIMPRSKNSVENLQFVRSEPRCQYLVYKVNDNNFEYLPDYKGKESGNEEIVYLIQDQNKKWLKPLNTENLAGLELSEVYENSFKEELAALTTQKMLAKTSAYQEKLKAAERLFDKINYITQKSAWNTQTFFKCNAPDGIQEIRTDINQNKNQASPNYLIFCQNIKDICVNRGEGRRRTKITEDFYTILKAINLMDTGGKPNNIEETITKLDAFVSQAMFSVSCKEDTKEINSKQAIYVSRLYR
jgi:hypothetical protein